MFSGDIELNPGPAPVLYFCIDSVQNDSPTKLSSNVVLEAKVKMLSVNLKYLYQYILVLHINSLIIQNF